MSMYIDYSTLDRIARLFSISKIARIAEINPNTLWTIIHRKTLDSNPEIMKKIALSLAANGIFIKRDNETNVEFAARVQEYCHKKHGEELNAA